MCRQGKACAKGNVHMHVCMHPTSVQEQGTYRCAGGARKGKPFLAQGALARVVGIKGLAAGRTGNALRQSRKQVQGITTVCVLCTTSIHRSMCSKHAMKAGLACTHFLAVSSVKPLWQVAQLHAFAAAQLLHCAACCPACTQHTTQKGKVG